MPPSPGYALDIVLTSKKLLGVVLLSSLTLINAMPFVLLDLGKLRMLSKSLNLFRILQTNLSLHKTVQNGMKEMGMKAAVKRKRPLLTKKHKRERMDFALEHVDWTVEDWKTVVWSDETKINCLGSDGRQWVWKKAGEGLSERLVKGTKKFGGGSLMMWG